jgi:hypothetical protein
MQRVAGNSLQAVGCGVWLLAGILSFFLIVSTVYQALGVVGIILAVMGFPLVYLVSVFVVWFTHGFPTDLAVLWVIGWVGMILATAGGNLAEKKM